MRPLSQVEPRVIDCLVADAALADAYLTALTAAPQARVHVPVPAGWASAPLPQSPVAGPARAAAASSGPLVGLAPRVRAAVRERRFGPALELLQDATEPYELSLRALVQSLRGNLRLAVADAKPAHQAAPGRAFGLFETIPQPEFALAWQYVPQAGLTASQVEVIDARKPSTEPPREKETAELRWEDEHLIFSLGIQLDASYEGFSYRMFVVDEEMRPGLHLVDHGRFRPAFAWRPQQKPTEEQYVLVVQLAVLTEAGGLLGGIVPAHGLIDIWEPIMLSGRSPGEFFVNKQIVVLLYPWRRTDASG